MTTAATAVERTPTPANPVFCIAVGNDTGALQEPSKTGLENLCVRFNATHGPAAQLVHDVTPVY